MAGSDEHNHPTVSSGQLTIDLAEGTLPARVVQMVPAGLCRRHQVMPCDLEERRLYLAMVRPWDIVAIDDVASVTGLDVVPVVATEAGMTYALNRYLRSDEELDALQSELMVTAEELDTDVTAEVEDDTPIVRFVNLIIAQAIADRASDIHIEPGERDVRVRYRIDGVLHEMQVADAAIKDGIVSRIKIMSEIDIAERRRPQDSRMSVLHNGRSVDVRVATLPTVWGEKIVMRILDHSASEMNIDDLAMSDLNLKRFTEAIATPHGMVLVTGPTGSGKSTTLYTAVTHVRSPQINVITVEDPVELRLSGISQVQINARAGLTFASALRSILRADPDVVLVGEIRDHETATISVEASLTGHLVLSTMHTNDAPSAMTRLTEIGVEPFLVGTAVTCVVAQRLARRLCTRCKVPYVEDLEQARAIGLPGADVADEGPRLYRAAGCSFCANTGYRGRIALHEIMPVSEDIERLVVERRPASDIRVVAMREGMVSLRDDGFTKVLLGLTTIEEVLRVAA